MNEAPCTVNFPICPGNVAGLRCSQPATWDIAAPLASGELARVGSRCAEHLPGRLEEWYGFAREQYDDFHLEPEDFVQVRPYDPALREPD